MGSAAVSIRANAAWMLGGTGVYAASQWLIAIVLARLGGPEAVGLFAFASALSMPVVVASQLALRQVLVTDVRRRYALTDYVRLRALATVGAFAFIVCLAAALGYRGEPLLVIASVAAGRCFESLSDIHYGRLQRELRLDRVAHFTMLRGFLCAAAVASTYLVSGSVGIAAVAFAAACALSALMVRVMRDGLPQEDLRRRGRWTGLYGASLATTALPLAASQFFGNLQGNIPRFVLEGTGGAALVGQLAVMEHFIAAAALIVQAAGQASSPHLARLFASRDISGFTRLLWRLFAFFSLVGIVASLVAWIGGPVIIRALYGTQFAAAEEAFVWLVGAASLGLISSVLGYAVTATGKFEGLAWRYGAAAAISLAVAVLLTPQAGLFGIAIAVACGHVASAFAALQKLRQHLSK